MVQKAQNGFSCIGTIRIKMKLSPNRLLYMHHPHVRGQSLHQVPQAMPAIVNVCQRLHGILHSNKLMPWMFLEAVVNVAEVLVYIFLSLKCTKDDSLMLRSNFVKAKHLIK